MVGAAPESKLGDEFLRPFRGIRDVGRHRRGHHVVQHGKIGDQVKLLEDEPHVLRPKTRPALGTHRAEVTPTDGNHALVRSK